MYCQESTITMNIFESNGQKMAFVRHGSGKPVFIWAHGWGQSHTALEPLAKDLADIGTHYVIDFPGFGESPLPKDVWAATDYTDYLKAFIKSLNVDSVIWVCHSFGSRIGLRIAATSDMISQLVIIGGHGIPLKRPLWKRIKMFISVRTFKFMKLFVRTEKQLESLRAKFGSPDYRNAGAIRPIFMKIIQDDVSDIASNVKCPAALFYGAEDRETPPEMGARLAKLIPNAVYECWPRYDHYSILQEGKHQLLSRIQKIVKERL